MRTGLARDGKELKSADRALDKKLRQDRFELADEDCFLLVDGVKHDVINYSPFGIAVTVREGSVADGNVEGRLFIGDSGVDQLQLQKVREEADRLGLRIVAFEITGSPLSVERVQAITETRLSLALIQSEFSTQLAIPSQFRLHVHEAKEMLECLLESVNSSRERKKFESNSQVEEYETAVVDIVSSFLFQHFKPVYSKLSQSLEGCDEEVVKAAYEFFRKQLKHIIYESRFADRSYNKPLGYAGDFEVMNLIYRNENIGDHLFAKCIHRYFVEHPETKAVKNRAHYLGRKITAILKERGTEEKIRILSVASGPAVELETLIRTWTDDSLENVEFHLLDQDLVSLKHAQRQIKEACRVSGKTPTLKYFNKSIKEVVVRGLGVADYHLIYSAGLFDYFSDPVAEAAAKQLQKGLVPGGQLVIGNFNASTPNRFFMEAALDWHLVFRSKEDLERLFGNVGNGITVESEPETVNLFCVIR